MKNASWDIALSKTGYINEAGRCLVMRAIMDDASFIPLPDGEGNLLELVKRRRGAGDRTP